MRINLKDAYFSVPIHPQHRNFLRFRWQGKCFQFTCLPFGLASAPWVFTKVLKPVLGFLQSRGIRCVIYLDNLLLLHQNRDTLKEHTASALTPLEALVNYHNYVGSKVAHKLIGKLVACYAIKAFVKNRQHVSILLLTDNMPVVAHVNRQDTFCKYYFRPTEQALMAAEYGRSILKQSTNMHRTCWRNRSPLKYNPGLAKAALQLNAVPGCMRRVKVNIVSYPPKLIIIFPPYIHMRNHITLIIGSHYWMCIQLLYCMRYAFRHLSCRIDSEGQLMV